MMSTQKEATVRVFKRSLNEFSDNTETNSIVEINSVPLTKIRFDIYSAKNSNEMKPNTVSICLVLPILGRFSYDLYFPTDLIQKRSQ